MKKIEIISFGLKSLFKTTIYFAFIPLVLMFLLGIIVLIIGIVSSYSELILVGIIYMVIPFGMIIFYGLFTSLVGLIYNIFLKKYGGLELTVKAIDEEHFEMKEENK